MSKELEALERVGNNLEHHYSENIKDFNILKQALTRLEAIDNANPSEALERLENNKNAIPYAIDYRIIKQALIKSQEQEKEIDRLENQCLDVLADNIRLKNKSQEQENTNGRAFGKDIINLNKTLKQTIDKPIFYASRYGNKYIVPQKLFEEQEKVLEIIFEKEVSIFQLKSCKNVNEYNDLKFKEENKLTEEEFDLVKRYSNEITRVKD